MPCVTVLFSHMVWWFPSPTCVLVEFITAGVAHVPLIFTTKNKNIHYVVRHHGRTKARALIPRARVRRTRLFEQERRGKYETET